MTTQCCAVEEVYGALAINNIVIPAVDLGLAFRCMDVDRLNRITVESFVTCMYALSFHRYISNRFGAVELS
jgi:hypothetical protein